MKIFIGSASPGNDIVLGLSIWLRSYLDYGEGLENREDLNNVGKIDEIISISGSSIMAMLLAMDFSLEERYKVSTFLKTFTQSYGWNEGVIDNLINNPANVNSSVQPIIHMFNTVFGDKRLGDVKIPVGIIVYNLTGTAFEILSSKYTPNIKIVTALLMSISMPGYFCGTKYGGDDYIDASIINRYPTEMLDSDTVGIYFQSESDSYVNLIFNAINRPRRLRDNDIVICPKSEGLNSTGMDKIIQGINIELQASTLINQNYEK